MWFSFIYDIFFTFLTKLCGALKAFHSILWIKDLFLAILMIAHAFSIKIHISLAHYHFMLSRAKYTIILIIINFLSKWLLFIIIFWWKVMNLIDIRGIFLCYKLIFTTVITTKSKSPSFWLNSFKTFNFIFISFFNFRIYNARTELFEIILFFKTAILDASVRKSDNNIIGDSRNNKNAPSNDTANNLKDLIKRIESFFHLSFKQNLIKKFTHAWGTNKVINKPSKLIRKYLRASAYKHCNRKAPDVQGKNEVGFYIYFNFYICI